MSECALPEGKDLAAILQNPTSIGHVENLLDVIAALIWDCNFQSAKNSKAIQSFIQRFSDVANVIYSQRAKYTDFELVKVIGQGGFGRVQLVREKNTRRVYAMKMMSKQHLLDHSQSGYWEERDIMVKADSEWLVACHQAFVDKENIYLCMEYMPGGDLYYWLEHYDTFTEEQARFYLAETVLALEALHGLGYIHRDLKPDNMLLDATGHLKLADFGSCVRMDASGTYFCASPIGTPDYISPEMLNCQSKAGCIGPECDWWALGVIAYEMLFGETAFYGQSLVETYSRILGHEKSLKIPTDTEITPEFEQLIRDFLRPASVRLGCPSKVPGEPGGAAAVKLHKFFANIDWSGLRSSTPPIQPVVTSDVDTSNINFDESELTTSKFANGSGNGNAPTNLPRSQGAFAPKKAPTPAYFTGENLAFAGFTFNRDASYVKPKIEEVAVDREEMAVALAEARAQLQAAERQATIDQIALKEAQDRLNDANAELMEISQDRTQIQTVNEELNVQLTALETERDALVDRVNRLQLQLTSASENLENERKTSACIREESSLLGKENADLKVKLATLQSASSEAEAKPLVPAKEDDQRQRSAVGEAEFLSMKESLEEARRQNSLITAEVASARRLHAEEIGDLSDQLQVSKHFADLYKSQLAEAEEALALARKKEETLMRDICVYKANLETANAARLESKDKIFKLESSLAVAQAESSSMKKNFEGQLKDALNQAARHRQLAASRQNDLETITHQRAELMEHCKALEASVATLTTQMQSMRDENASQKTRLDQAVIKLAEVAAGLPTVTGKKKTTSDSAKVSQLQKQLRNAEHNYHKEVIGMQSTIDRLKADNSEKAETVAELTETKQRLEAELTKAHSQINELYDWLDVKPGGRHGIAPVASDTVTGSAVCQRVVDNSARSSPSGTLSLQERSPMSLSLESLESLQNLQPERTSTIRLQPQAMSPLEGVCDFPERCRGRHKLAWTPKYVVISPFTIAFYGSKEHVGSAPCDEIQIGKIFSVRAGTVLDLNYATTDDVSRLICIVSDEMTALDGSGGDGCDVTLSSRMPFTPNTTLNTTSTQPGGAIGTGSGNISWHGHSFQPMTFRIPNTMCEVCRRPCSDLLSPPPALECVRCRMRIHRHHVEHHEKFVVCPKTVKQWLIRAPDPVARKEWISRIKQLQERYAELQRGTDSPISPSSLTYTPFSKFNRPLSSSTRYSSMRNFGHVLSNRETTPRRSIALPTTFPRTASNSSGSTNSTTQPTHTIPPESQHDL